MNWRRYAFVALLLAAAARPAAAGFAPARVAAAAAQESSLASGDAPGGIDFRSRADVTSALQAARVALARVDANESPELFLALRRQQEVLSRQRDLLAEHEQLLSLQAEVSQGALLAAGAARDAAQAARLRFEPHALEDHLRETLSGDDVAALVRTEYEEPAKAARVAAVSAESARTAAAAELAQLPQQRDAATAAAAAAAAELGSLRARGLAGLATAEQRLRLEESLTAEQELVHQRQRAEWLRTLEPWLALRVERLTLLEQEAAAQLDLREAMAAAARHHLQERRAEEARTAADEVRQQEEAVAGSADAAERSFREEELVSSRLEAMLPTLSSAALELALRVESAEEALAAAQGERDGYVVRYRGDRSKRAEDDDPIAVARAIQALQEQTRFLDHQSTRAVLRGELRAAEEALESSTTAAARRQEALAGRRADEPRWRELERARRQLEQQVAAAALEQVLALRRLLAIDDSIWSARNEALAILRSENLFLVEESEISRDALASALDDVLSLPRLAASSSAALARFVMAPGHRGALLLCLAVLLPLVAGAIVARRWLAARLARLLALDLASLPVRNAALLTQLLRCACTAATLWLAPRLCAALLPDLPTAGADLLHGLGDRLAAFWLGLGVVRELLEPSPPERQVLAVDRRTARRVGAAVRILLWTSLGATLLELPLTRLGWRNSGGLAALDLAFHAVVGALLVFVLLQRQLLFSLLPGPDRPLGRLVRRAATLIHPILVLLVPAVVVLDATGYRILAAFITRLAVLSLTAFPIGSIAYQAVVFVIEAWRDRQLARLPEPSSISAAEAPRDEDDSAGRERARLHAVDEILRFLLRVAVILLLLLALLQFTGTSFASLRSFFERPLPLQDDGDAATRRTWWDVVIAALIAFLTIRVARHLKLALADLILPLFALARSTRYTITTLATYVLHGVGFWLAASHLFDLANLGYLVAALSVGIGFGLQEIISNFVSGLILLLERPIKPGDTISLGDGQIGTVLELGIRATTIQTADNIHVLVPNREFITQRVVNHDAIDPRVRASLVVGVAYGSDVKRVRDVLLEVAAKDGRLLRRPAAEVWFLRFNDSSLDFRLTVWLQDSTQVARITSDLHFAVEAAFARNGIAIPFPHREVVLRADAPLPVRLSGVPDAAAGGGASSGGKGPPAPTATGEP
jgi:small-conductance mechanosensitive channel